MTLAVPTFIPHRLVVKKFSGPEATDGFSQVLRGFLNIYQKTMYHIPGIWLYTDRWPIH